MFILTLILAVVSKCTAQSLPSYFPKCCIHDPKLSECLLRASTAAKPFVRKGIDEMHLPSLRNAVFDKIVFHQKTELVDFNATLINYRLQGLHDYDLKELQYDPKTFTFRGVAKLKPLTLNTLYELHGRLLYIPVEGEGTVDAVFGPIKGKFKINGKLVNISGVEYYNATKVSIKMTVDDLKVQLEGLFRDNKELGRLTNVLINENSKPIVDAATPSLEKLLEDTLRRVIAPLNKAIPYKELFPCTK